MRIAAIIMATAVFLIDIGRAAAQFVDGNQLMERCRSSSSADSGYCAGYIAGSVDRYVMDSESPFLPYKPHPPCPNLEKGGVTVGQLRDAVLGELNAHLSARHKWAGSDFVTEALHDFFHCQ